MITTISAPEAVVNYFKEQIRCGALKPNASLPAQRELQKTLGISRFSLREGLARLSALGIIRIHHGKGAWIASDLSETSLQDVFLPLFTLDNPKINRDLFEARVVIESQSAALAATRRIPAMIEALEDIVAQGASALDDAEAFGSLDHQFHRAVAAASGNIFLQRMLDAITEQVHAFLIAHARSESSRRRAQQWHRRIFEHIRDGGHDKVGDAVRTHIAGCMKGFTKTDARDKRASRSECTQ
jgi:GntR family transcriptional repressor for pyruvate dehydrogenase complex